MTELYLVFLFWGEIGLPLSDCVFKALVSDFYSCSKNTETTILSVDAEKCLQSKLEFFICSFTRIWFHKLVKNSSPTACVRTNEQTSSSFCLQRAPGSDARSPLTVGSFHQTSSRWSSQESIIYFQWCKPSPDWLDLWKDLNIPGSTRLLCSRHS